MGESCVNCRFWMPSRSKDTCRRRSPISMPGKSMTGRWPYASCDDWCGEWEGQSQESTAFRLKWGTEPTAFCGLTAEDVMRQIEKREA